MALITLKLRVGSFPHQMYVARCACPDGKEEPTVNYARHVVGPPKCSSCKRPYELQEELCDPTWRRAVLVLLLCLLSFWKG